VGRYVTDVCCPFHATPWSLNAPVSPCRSVQTSRRLCRVIDARPEGSAKRTAESLRLVEEGAILVPQIGPRRADIELHAAAGAVPVLAV